MKKYIYWVVISYVLLSLQAAQAARKALLIGNASYDQRPLRNPTNDVQDLKEKLTALGFHVTSLTNKNRKVMRDSIRSFADQVKAGDEVLFYYSGHGAQFENINYLIPIKHNIQHDFEIEDEAVSLNYVLQHLRRTQSLYNLVILDACRDNPFQGQAKSLSRGLAPLKRKPQGTLVAFSASPGQISNDGHGRNGTYTQYLLKHIATPNKTINQVLALVSADVVDVTNKKQYPIEENGLLTDVFLAQKNGDEGKPKDEPIDEPEMVFIQGGSFLMGSPEDEKGRDDDEHQHRVKVDDFYMGKYEVTVGEFKRFVSATGYKTDAEMKGDCYALKDGELGDQSGYSWRRLDFSQSDNHPVACVSWNDAQAYTVWLSQKTGKRYRLPTEAEWEYASRGGSQHAHHWGDSPNQACSYANVVDQSVKRKIPSWSWTIHDCNDGYVYTAPVGHYQANGLGLKDILGNVWEWTCSNYDKDYGSSEQHCVDIGRSGDRVYRGGSWLYGPRYVRSSNRYRNDPSYRFNDVGFRLSRMP